VRIGHFKELDDLELTSVATVIAMSTPIEYLAFSKRMKEGRGGITACSSTSASPT
jgi:hypothetical protein